MPRIVARTVQSSVPEGPGLRPTAYFRVAQEPGKDGKPILAFASQAEWEAWLDAEHRASDGVWIKFAKGSGETVVYAEALEVALCYGWIDSQVKSLDERFYLQKSRRGGRGASGRESTARRSRS